MFRNLSWLFGLVCIALTWPRLRRQRWWLRLSGLAGCSEWEWWRSSRPPAGRAMPCIKLLPLPPPCGSHWLVGGFQRCRECTLSCCCSLSLAWRLPCRVVVSDMDDDRSFLAPGSLSCRCCVLASVACVLEGQNRNFSSCLCHSCFPRPASRSIVLASLCLVVSCVFAGIVSQGLARP